MFRSMSLYVLICMWFDRIAILSMWYSLGTRVQVQTRADLWLCVCVCINETAQIKCTIRNNHRSAQMRASESNTFAICYVLHICFWFAPILRYFHFISFQFISVDTFDTMCMQHSFFFLSTSHMLANRIWSGIIWYVFDGCMCIVNFLCTLFVRYA